MDAPGGDFDRNMKTGQSLISLLFGVAVVTALGAGSSSSTNSDDLVIHEPSRTVLPSRVGLFQRSETKPFDKAGRDVGIGYDVDHLIKGDVYIYPVGAPGYGKDLSSEFQVQQNAINRLNRDVRLVSRENLQLNQDGRAITGVHAIYDLRRDLFAQRNLKCGSQLYIFRDGSWFIAYRFSYPRDKSAVALKHIANFMASWQWRQIPRHIP
jgi:hypothetical protein